MKENGFERGWSSGSVRQRVGDDDGLDESIGGDDDDDTSLSAAGVAI